MSTLRGVTVTSGASPLGQVMEIGPHRLIADEPAALGGEDAGPTPTELLLASLGACTSMTLRLYARRKAWPLEQVSVQLTAEGPDSGGFRIVRSIQLAGALDEEQRTRLLEIANKCPVHRILTSGAHIETVEAAAQS